MTDATVTSPLNEFLLSKTQDSKLLSSQKASAYLTHLTSLALPSLLTEPQTLANEIGALTSQLTNLCTSEYSTFLSLHSASSTLSDSLDAFSSSLDSLLDSIPALESVTHDFASSAKSIQLKRRKANLVIEQHDKLLDILQVPQLIDTCVRNGYYAEAMDLSSHTNSLLSRFPNVPIIIDVASEAEQAIRFMISQLLALLREPAKLPALLKAINFLRRMGSLNEEELALAFLTSRALYLDSLFGGIERHRPDEARYLRRYVDIFREGVYDVVTQYTTIFLERAVEQANLHAKLLHLLQMFSHTYISHLMDLLRGTVPHIDDPTSLTSLLTQLTYCATSFARIGLDFRSLLPHPFLDAVLNNAKRLFSDASEDFVTQIEKNGHRPPSTWLIAPSLLASLPYSSPPTLDEKSPAHIAPNVLSSYPLLATYTNSILIALNSLRSLAPISLLPHISILLETSLALVGHSLLSRSRAITGDIEGSSEEKNVENYAFDATGMVFVGCLVPFVLRALYEGVYAVKIRKDYEGSSDLSVMQKEWEDWLLSSNMRRAAVG